MPCAAAARGTRAGVPNPPGHIPPFNDAIDNNPCGKPIVSTVNSVSVAAENLCLFHWSMKWGSKAVVGAITYGA
jgi:hypothetical protein